MGGSLPSLARFRDKHKDDRRFEIVAFHDASVGSLAELDRKLTEKGIRQKHWGGRDLPFPVLLDATRETLNRLQIHAFPMTILIDPQGRLRRGGVLELARALDLEMPGDG